MDNSNSYALLIGVGKRKDDSQAMAVTIDDVKYLNCELTKHCGYKPAHVRKLTSKNAVKDDIFKELNHLAKISQEKEIDTLIVYFSGHGFRYTENNTTSYYLICNNTTSSNFKETSLKGDEFVSKLNNIKSKQMLILLDCCHAAGITADGITPTTTPLPKKALLSHAFNRAIINSSHSAMPSYTGTPTSVFTFALLEGLVGEHLIEDETTVRIFDLAMYVRERVITLTNGDQKPQLDVLPNSLTSNFPIVSYENGIPMDLLCDKDNFDLYGTNGKRVDYTKQKLIRDQEYRDKFNWIVNDIKFNGNDNVVLVNSNNNTFIINQNTSKNELEELITNNNLILDQLLNAINSLSNKNTPFLSRIQKDLNSIKNRSYNHDRSAIIKFLRNKMDHFDLQEFCYLNYYEVFKNFAPGMEHRQRVLILMAHVDRYDKLDELVILLKEEQGFS